MTDGEKTLRNHLDHLKDINAAMDKKHPAKKALEARVKECREAIKAEHEKSLTKGS